MSSVDTILEILEGNLKSEDSSITDIIIHFSWSQGYFCIENLSNQSSQNDRLNVSQNELISLEEEQKDLEGFKRDLILQLKKFSYIHLEVTLCLYDKDQSTSDPIFKSNGCSTFIEKIADLEKIKMHNMMYITFCHKNHNVELYLFTCLNPNFNSMLFTGGYQNPLATDTLFTKIVTKSEKVELLQNVGFIGSIDNDNFKIVPQCLSKAFNLILHMIKEVKINPSKIEEISEIIESAVSKNDSVTDSIQSKARNLRPRKAEVVDLTVADVKKLDAEISDNHNSSAWCDEIYYDLASSDINEIGPDLGSFYRHDAKIVDIGWDEQDQFTNVKERPLQNDSDLFANWLKKLNPKLLPDSHYDSMKELEEYLENQNHLANSQHEITTIDLDNIEQPKHKCDQFGTYSNQPKLCRGIESKRLTFDLDIEPSTSTRKSNLFDDLEISSYEEKTKQRKFERTESRAKNREKSLSNNLDSHRERKPLKYHSPEKEHSRLTSQQSPPGPSRRPSIRSPCKRVIFKDVPEKYKTRSEMMLQKVNVLLPGTSSRSQSSVPNRTSNPTSSQMPPTSVSNFLNNSTNHQILDTIEILDDNDEERTSPRRNDENNNRRKRKILDVNKYTIFTSKNHPDFQSPTGGQIPKYSNSKTQDRRSSRH